MGQVGLRRARNGATPDRPPMTREEIASLLHLVAEHILQLPAPQAPDTLLTAKEASEQFNLSTYWLYRHWKDGEFGFRLSPRKIRFSQQGLLAYIAGTRGTG